MFKYGDFSGPYFPVFGLNTEDYITGHGLILLYTGLGLINWTNQAEMPLEKYEDVIVLSVKQLVIQ